MLIDLNEKALLILISKVFKMQKILLMIQNTCAKIRYFDRTESFKQFNVRKNNIVYVCLTDFKLQVKKLKELYFWSPIYSTKVRKNNLMSSEQYFGKSISNIGSLQDVSQWMSGRITT